MGGNIESHLLAVQHRLRQLVVHQGFQQEFLARSPDLEPCRQGRGKLHDAMIQERRAHLNGVSHADTIDFGQNVIWQKVLLIEP
jgi:hypothetical protein